MNIWIRAQDKEWIPTALQSAAVLDCGSVDLVASRRVVARRGEVLLLPSTANTREATWMLLAPAASDVRINGMPLENGIRVLADRDALRVAALPVLYFSTERLARLEPFPGEETVFCPRDKTAICKGDAAVCCPQCGVWHHEQEAAGKACWSYAETCTLCDQSTDLDAAGYRWTPGGL